MIQIEPLAKNPVSEIIKGEETRWSSKNILPAKHISARCSQEVWMTCPQGIHDDYPTKAYDIKNTINQ
jgi:hypothetical protein